MMAEEACNEWFKDNVFNGHAVPDARGNRRIYWVANRA